MTDRVAKSWAADGPQSIRFTTSQSARHLGGIHESRRSIEKSDDALKELAEALKHGKIDTLLKYLDTLSRFHRYSFGNCILIGVQRPDASMVAGLHRWKQLGRWVKKDEKGIAILAPMVSRKDKESDSAEVGEEPSETRTSTLCGFRVAYVFDVQQTEGKELPEFAHLGGDPGDKIDRLVDITTERGIDVEFVDSLPGGANGVSLGGMVQVVSTLPAPQKFYTLVHYLAQEL